MDGPVRQGAHGINYTLVGAEDSDHDQRHGDANQECYPDGTAFQHIASRFCCEQENGRDDHE